MGFNIVNWGSVGSCRVNGSSSGPGAAPLIATHDGIFHCDDALACFLLRRLPDYRDAKIVRTRDPDVLSVSDVVVDVGGVYDPERHRYDHHQRSFKESMSSLRTSSSRTTKLSSAGLIFHHFGERILAQILGFSLSDPKIPVLWEKMYVHFMEEIDAIDNGIPQFDGEPRYLLTTNLSARISHLNPTWNSGKHNTEDSLQTGFSKAMTLVGDEFLGRLKYYSESWLPARGEVERAVNGSKEVDVSGEIIVLDMGGCPWKEHLFELERELAIRPIKFVLFPDGKGLWRVQAVPETPTSFSSRLPLPESWRGLRDEELSSKSGIDGCIFVHASGFIGGNRSRDGALRMARETLRGGGEGV